MPMEHKHTDASEDGGHKAVYLSPVIVEYGDAREITRTHGFPSGVINDGGGPTIYTS